MFISNPIINHMFILSPIIYHMFISNPIIYHMFILSPIIYHMSMTAPDFRGIPMFGKKRFLEVPAMWVLRARLEDLAVDVASPFRKTT